MLQIQFWFKDMTGLSMKYAEPFQVQNYGVAGHFNLHWDQIVKGAVCNSICENGNRLATALFYVSPSIQSDVNVVLLNHLMHKLRNIFNS